MTDLALLASTVTGVERAWRANRVVPAGLIGALVAGWALHTVGLAYVSKPAIVALFRHMSDSRSVVTRR